ncbi:MAG: FAD-binding protein [Bacteroidota bacterium]|nr:FAD-binding protein [Bacteroidota bacterium]
MQKNISVSILPSEAANDELLKKYIADAGNTSLADITGYTIIKKSIDARGKQPKIQLSLLVFINEPYQRRKLLHINFADVRKAEKGIIVIGAGPAGLFAALRLIESGIKPIILERGKDVRARRRDLALMNKEGIINPESNYCFGEGGAGTYSDGKLYTRSTKRGDIERILNLFVQFGAEEKILYESHPHIGTNKLPQIITAIRQQIIDCGGEYWFQKRVTDFIIKNKNITGVKTADGSLIHGDAVILATGHSARDIFELLHSKKIAIEFKPFALGVRVEHPQSLIDSIQYSSLQIPVNQATPVHTRVGSASLPDGAGYRSPYLPPASYSLVHQVEGKGVFSFCMCPGGIIAPAATNIGEIVVNGWSPSKRNNPYANSGIVVTVEEKDVQAFKKYDALAGMYFQQMVEQKAYEAGGGKLVAPAQRLVDFVENKISSSFPACSYLPGMHAASLKDVLPFFIYKNLRQGFLEFGKKMPARHGSKGYLTNDAVVVAAESRTSSPVRIPRDAKTLHHPQLKNLYPCGEGAGYAGGIVSAAMDGENVANQISITIGLKDQ